MLKIKEFHLKVEKTARYFSNDNVGNKITNLWIVIHGYAQLASDFIKEFEFLEDKNTLIVAPEGLSKFYFKNNIGASWMTKEDRQNEINDYLNYLDKLLYQLKNEYDVSNAKLNLLGFSQGVHTAVRCFINSEFKFEKLILCSSDFPKDIDFEKLKIKSQNAKLYFIYGLKDEIINQKRYDESLNFLEKNNTCFSIIEFDGGHQIDRQSIIEIFTK